MKFCPIDKGFKGGVTFCDFPMSKNTGLTRKPLEILDVVPRTTWEDRETMRLRIMQSKASHIICSDQLKPFSVHAKKLYFVPNPRLTFMRLLEKEHRPRMFEDLMSGCMTYPDHVHIGRNVRIGAGSVIGGPGFGMWRRRTGQVMAFKQLGKVVIEDDVEIHCNVCIDRGALGETRIGMGTKIDNLVHIAHNAQIGKHCVIVAHAMIGGSVVIEDRVWVGPCASLLNGIRIGHDAVIGMGAIVLRDVMPESTVIGVVK